MRLTTTDRATRRSSGPRTWLRRGLRGTILTAALASGLALAGGDWNDAQIQWQPYEQGLATAKAQHKPLCVVFYTEWCPHCQSYSQVFHDPQVVERAKQFVMVRLDKDKNPSLSSKLAPDGEYIPRTYFLGADGRLDPEIHAARDKYLYFYNEHDPASILTGMQTALRKLGGKPGAAPKKPAPAAAAPPAKPPKPPGTRG